MKYLLFVMICLSFGLRATGIMQLQYETIKTSHGRIAYVDTGGTGFPVLFIHGNSCSSQVFKKQISTFRDRYRIIAVDLPGHGKSSCAGDPENDYTIPGYAKVIHEVANHLGLKHCAVVGFSLGGNIALQYSQLARDSIKGIMMISSAPMKYSDEALIAYPPHEGSYAACPDQLTEAQARQYMLAGGFDVDDPSVYFMVEDAMKTDGKARENMVASVLAGRGIDETEIVSELNVPLAVVAGKEDTVINLDYLTQLNYRNLWHGNVEFVELAEHAIPVHQSDQLCFLLDTFLKDIQN